MVARNNFQATPISSTHFSRHTYNDIFHPRNYPPPPGSSLSNPYISTTPLPTFHFLSLSISSLSMSIGTFRKSSQRPTIMTSKSFFSQLSSPGRSGAPRRLVVRLHKFLPTFFSSSSVPHPCSKRAPRRLCRPSHSSDCCPRLGDNRCSKVEPGSCCEGWRGGPAKRWNSSCTESEYRVSLWEAIPVV